MKINGIQLIGALLLLTTIFTIIIGVKDLEYQKEKIEKITEKIKVECFDSKGNVIIDQICEKSIENEKIKNRRNYYTGITLSTFLMGLILLTSNNEDNKNGKSKHTRKRNNKTKNVVQRSKNSRKTSKKKSKT